MKIPCRRAVVLSALVAALYCMAVQSPGAAELNSQDTVAKIVRQDSGVKAQIKEAKGKIADEREAILAAGRRLSQAKKTRDTAVIEQVKREVDAEIKERKNAISVLKSQIEGLQGSSESLAPRSKGAVDR